MPDIWTFNQEKVLRALEDSGANCGASPRVLKNRDPQWTCLIDLESPNKDGVIGYDIYIHHAAEFFMSSLAISGLVLLFGLGFAIGFFWRPRF